MCAVSALYRNKGFKFPNLPFRIIGKTFCKTANYYIFGMKFPQNFHVRAIEMPRRPGSHGAAEFRKFRVGNSWLRAWVSTSKQNSNIQYNRCNSIMWLRGITANISSCDVIESTIKTPSGDIQIDTMLPGRSGHLLTNHWPSDRILATYGEQVKPRGIDCSGRSEMFAVGNVYARIVVSNKCLPELDDLSLLQLGLDKVWDRRRANGLALIHHASSEAGVATRRCHSLQKTQHNCRNLNQVYISSFVLEAVWSCWRTRQARSGMPEEATPPPVSVPCSERPTPSDLLTNVTDALRATADEWISWETWR